MSNHGIERQFGELANREYIVRGVMGFAPLKLKALMAHLGEKDIRGSGERLDVIRIRSKLYLCGLNSLSMMLAEIRISGNMGSFLLVC